MYTQQGGMCGICGKDMKWMIDKMEALEVDHKNPKLVKGYNNRRNLQLAHALCNRQKSGKSIPVQAKATGKSMTDLV
jgi:5-methylcytosine-specific restriction endonuclease McrA